MQQEPENPAGTKVIDLPRREAVLDQICEAFPGAPIVSTTGFTSRELFELREARGEGECNVVHEP